MTIVLGLIVAAGAAAVIVCVFAWNPGWAEADGPTEGWNPPVYRIGQWAEENHPHYHSEPTLEEITSCLYCGSVSHSTFLHASR
jgi:5-methylcytosine-specific restriction endonuclease McrA